MSARKSDTGNGDLCPVDPEHGIMLVPPGMNLQWCPHVEHDGIWSRVSGKQPPTRSHWPLFGFEEAVLEHNDGH